jgi:hypothetical protein
MPGGKQGGVDVAPLMRGGGMPPSLSQSAADRPSHAGGVRVAVSADGHQAGLSGAVTACRAMAATVCGSGAVAAFGAAWGGANGMDGAVTPTGVDPPDRTLTTLTRAYMLFSSNNYQISHKTPPPYKNLRSVISSPYDLKMT